MDERVRLLGIAYGWDGESEVVIDLSEPTIAMRLMRDVRLGDYSIAEPADFPELCPQRPVAPEQLIAGHIPGVPE